MSFNEISVLLVTASIFGGFARLLKQPLIIGYLFAGFLLSYLGIVHDVEAFSGLGQIGIALLLFLVGLEMNLSELPIVGKVAIITGISQIITTSVFGFLVSLIFGFAPLPAIYMGAALSFSSTIIIVKLLSEKKDLGALYGKISIGFLLVQDLVAVIILMFLAGLKTGSLGPSDIALIAVKGAILIAVIWALAKKVLPFVFDKFLANSQELLFISSIAWALGVSAFVGGPLGFTLEIGGFMAGISLSGLPEHLQIASKAKSLRDFFLTIFFMVLGTKIVFDNIGEIIPPALIYSAIVMIVNPLVVISILGLLGYTRRTSFLSGLMVAQISEFSLILMTMGASLGHVDERQVSIIIVVGVITMTMSTYLILGAERIFRRIKKYLGIFERKSPSEQVINTDKVYKDHTVLVGADRTGKSLINFFKNKAQQFVVVDFNPNVFKELTAEKTDCIFGDIGDAEIMDRAGIESARLVVSTISNLPANLVLLEYIKGLHKKPITIFSVTDRGEGLKLYEKGADYVIVPQRVAGEHLRHILSVYGISEDRIKQIGKANFNRLIAR